MMSRTNMRPVRLLAVLALLAALPARAEIRGVLQEPREGQVLRGGTTATIAWTAPELPKFAEEWEAFLSADGGRYYGYRITPHIDLAQRRFTFEVPNVGTNDARILIRAGDERREVEIELPVRFSIRQDRVRTFASGPSTVVDDERGEAARPGEPGVIGWIDGDRDGDHLTARSALRSDETLRGTPRLAASSEAVEGAGTLPVAAAPAETATRRTAVADATACNRLRALRAGRNVLLAGSRLNL
jgi:hypothetical protein